MARSISLSLLLLLITSASGNLLGIFTGFGRGESEVRHGFPPKVVADTESKGGTNYATGATAATGRGHTQASVFLTGRGARPESELSPNAGLATASRGEVQRNSGLDPLCWGKNSECCYQEAHSGYLCTDDYADRSIRCHPRISFRVACENDAEPAPDRPALPIDRVKKDEVIIKRFWADSVAWQRSGVPSIGMSDTYFARELPGAPRVVETDGVGE